MGYKSFLTELGIRIKSIRERNFPGESLTAVAHRAMMKGQQLKEIEEGSGNPTLKTLNRIAEALEIDIKDLFKTFSKKRKR